MRQPRNLSGDEAALWARVAATVKPMKGRPKPPFPSGERPGVGPVPSASPTGAPAPTPTPALKGRGYEVRPLDRHGLDSSWDRKLSKGTLSPDFTLDLHGHSLDAAWSRLEHGLAQAQAHGARVVLVITGRARAVERGGGHGQRGVIRAKLLDWLAHGGHAGKIAAVRGAHPRHGGAGAVYVVLKKGR